MTKVRVSSEAYLALPWKVVFFVSASVEWDEKVCAAISVCERELSLGHGFSRGSYIYTQSVIVGPYPSAVHHVTVREGIQGDDDSRAELPRPTASFTVSTTVMVCN
jgi:hypothetical protein